VAKKSRDQLILADKLDIERAKINLAARRWVRRQKNEREHQVLTEHWKQVQSGKVKELPELTAND
jgi:hypothetical protein